MRRNRPRRRNRNRWWYLRVAIAAIAVISALAWLLPRRVQDVVSVDGEHRWHHTAAPPRQRIVWQPAQAVAGEDGPLAMREAIGPSFSLVHPQLADGGTTLYFTAQPVEAKGNNNDEARSADIYRSSFDGRTWSRAVAVEALNSDADDFGPVISADGRELYIYSDRAGGHGGFDLYVSRRTAEGWTVPENLGPRINSPAQEYDPAITPDGGRLLFSSNRTDNMQRRQEASDTRGGDAWKATLRAEPGLRQFDIYAARRETPLKEWGAPAPLKVVNSTASNEGEPFVSPNGAFLYFASDRQNNSGTAANYDIYRCRIQGGLFLPPENLGRGVNSAANEHDPALSPEGFRIVFSSDRKQPVEGERADTYALYISQASEIYDDGRWDASHLGVIFDNLWGVLLLLLVVALLAALAWYVRQVSLRRAPVPVFFLIALLLHLLMTPVLFVPLGGMTIAERVKQQIDKIVATDVELDSSQPKRSENAFEKVADLQAAAAVDVAQAQRQPSAPVEVAVTQPVAPRHTAALQSEVQPVEIPPAPSQPIEADSPVLERRRPPLAEAFATAKVPLELTDPAEEAGGETVAQNENVSVDRQQLRQAEFDQVAVNTSADAPKLLREPVDAQRLASAVQPNASARNMPQFASRRPAAAAEFAPAQAKLEAELGEAASGGDESLVSAESVSAPRQSAELNAVAVASYQSPVANEGVNPSLQAEISANLPSFATAPSQRRAATNASLPRQDRLAKVDFQAAESRANLADAPAQPAAATGAGSSAPSENVAVGRNTNSGPDRDIDAELPSDGAHAGSGLIASENFTRPGPSARGASAPSSLDAVASLFRRGASATPDFAQAKATTEAVGEPAESSDTSELATADLEEIGVQRQAGDPSPLGEALADAGPARRSGDADRLQPFSDADGLPDAPDALALASDGATPFSLARRSLRGPLLPYAQDKIGLQAMLRLRVGDEETKEDLVEAFGGDKDTLVAIARGLTWLAKVQHEDGHWDLKKFPKPASGHGKSKSDTAATGLALLPFLGDGHTHQAGKYQQQVQRGIAWLLEHQKDDGNLFTGGEGNAHMYSHGIATIALCEAYGMTKDNALREPAQRAVDYIAEAQHGEGGWRYKPGDAGDTSVVGWQVMALKSAQIGGLDVPQQTLDRAKRYIENVRRGKEKAEFGYQKNGGTTPAMTAEGLLCFQYLGAKSGDAQLLRTAEFLSRRVPQKGKDTSYYWYYGTQAMFHMQGEPWRVWNEGMSQTLLSTQLTSGPNAGTWDPKDRWEQSGGRIMSTSLRLLMLEVYFRHLPLYHALD